MSPFVVVHDSPVSVGEAWARVTDWPRHGDHVPFTHVEVTTDAPPGVGTVFNARTRIGRLGFDDPMEVVGLAAAGRRRPRASAGSRSAAGSCSAGPS